METWKTILENENYEVSNFGNVRNKHNKKLLTGDVNNIGYRRVILYYGKKQRFFVHRLVAFYFCEGYAEGLVVNHKDGCKLNNNADNLEWVTRSENDLHAVRLGLRTPWNKGKKLGKRKKAN